MVIFLVIVVIAVILYFAVSIKKVPNDNFMDSIMSGADYPDCGVYKDFQTKKYYVSPYMLKIGDEKVFSGTKFQCESWIERKK